MSPQEEDEVATEFEPIKYYADPRWCISRRQLLYYAMKKPTRKKREGYTDAVAQRNKHIPSGTHVISHQTRTWVLIAAMMVKP